MKAWLISLVFAVAAGPAAALSCLPADPVRSYLDAAASDRNYVVLLGEIKINRNAFKRRASVLPDNDAKDVSARGIFNGKFLSKDGFSTDWAGAVTVTSRCFGPWCAGAPPEGEMLAYVEKTAQGYALNLSPCGGFAYAQPSRAVLEAVVVCHRGGDCVPELSMR